MATFYANPNGENEQWIETSAVDGLGFRIWHVMFICFAGFLTIIILICCCVKIRVPRTKQEIEADYRRKKLTAKFKERLMLIENSEMDAIDLKRALDIIQEDYKSEKKELLALQIYPGYNLGSEDLPKSLTAAEPHQAGFASFKCNP